MSRSKRVQWRRGMGILGFMLVVSFVMGGMVAHHEWKTGHGWAATRWILGGISLCFLLARAGIIVEGDRRQVTAWWGFRLPFLLNVPFFRKRWGVSRAAKVVLEAGLIGAGNHPVKAWFAYLEDGPRRKIFHFLGYVRARQEGERLADALDLPLHDQTVHGSPSHREAGALQRPLGERLRAAGRTFPLPPPRADAGVERTQEGGCAIFEAPKHLRKSLLRVRAPLTVMAVLASLLLFELTFEQAPPRALLGVVGVLVGIMALVALGLIYGATERIRLFASPAGLRRVRTTAFSHRGLEIPAGELEELDVGLSRTSSGGLILSGRSDRTLLEFGSGMKKEGLEWLLEEVLAALYGPEGPDPPPAGA